jgi:hypothetical protein
MEAYITFYDHIVYFWAAVHCWSAGMDASHLSLKLRITLPCWLDGTLQLLYGASCKFGNELYRAIPETAYGETQVYY